MSRFSNSNNYPLDWKCFRFDQLFKFVGGLSISRENLSDEGICYLHYGDIHTSTENYIDVKKDYDKLPKYNEKLQNINQKYFLNDGDIVIADASEDYEGIGKAVVIFNEENIPFISGLHTIVAKDKTDLIYRDFKRYFLSDWYIRKQMMFYATGISVFGLSKENVKKIQVILPPKFEQQKIAEILSTWDKAIELKEKLIEQKEEQKKGLMQRLLTGKVRLPGFEGEWIKLKIKDLIKEVNDRTTQNNQYEVLSVTKNGIVPQREQFNKQIASEDNTGYKIVRRYNLVFSTMNLWMGSLDVLTTHDIGIVSPAYKVFEFIEQNINPLFGKYFMLSDYMIRIYKLNSEQGASIVRRNLDMDGLLSSIVSVPPVEEQLEISKVLQSADDELTLLNSELEALKQQKKGLMQLLLTGKVRVKC